MRSSDDCLPFFFYGSLRSGEAAEGMVGDVAVRRISARAAGRRVETGAWYPGVVFGGDEEVEGELVWIEPGAFAETVEKLDAYERVPTLYTRVRIEAHAGSETHAAFAYDYSGGTPERED
jgi:gamma-glutamylcyclotransferase (GGCT)/AIG2-like uncharacterized protein YtfP